MTARRTALFTKRKPGHDAQHQLPPVRHPDHRPDMHQRHTTIKVVLGIVGTVFFLAIGHPGPAIMALAAASLSLRTPAQRH
jgi:hypothetical protein